MEQYILDLAEEQAPVRSVAGNLFDMRLVTDLNDPASRILNSPIVDWNDDDVECVLINSDCYLPTEDSVWKAYPNVNPDECDCYVCTRRLSYRNEDGSKTWKINQLLPDLSTEIWNHRVVCSTCYAEKQSMTLYHRSFGYFRLNPMARQEAITTLLQAVKTYYSKYS